MIPINRSIPSPNFTPRETGTKIDTIIVHHTAMYSAESAIKALCSVKTQVSAHFVIAKDGEVFELVPSMHKAWHAGVSFWRGRHKVNDFSIGIELDNNGCEPFPEAQIDSLISLINLLKEIHPIDARNIIAHADVAPNRKVDPSEHLSWEQLYKHGIGIYSNVNIAAPEVLFKYSKKHLTVRKLKEKFATFGYLIQNPNDEFDKELLNIIHAFKRHYCPETYDTTFWDSLAQARLDNLLNMMDG
jgi:N-acetylmuramoyl-L-alanine amidase